MSPLAAVSGPVMTLASVRSCSEATALVLRRSQSVNKSSHWGIALLCSQQSKPGRSLAITRQTQQRHFNITKAMASEENAAVTEQDGGSDSSIQPNLVIVGAGTLGTLAAQCWKQASAFRMDSTRFHHRITRHCPRTLVHVYITTFRPSWVSKVHWVPHLSSSAEVPHVPGVRHHPHGRASPSASVARRDSARAGLASPSASGWRSSLCALLRSTGRKQGLRGRCQVSTDARTHARTHTHARAHTHTHTHKHTHTRTHTHIHAHSPAHPECHSCCSHMP